MRVVALITLLICGGVLYSQGPEVLAKSFFLQAQEKYSNEEYALALADIGKVKGYLNGTNPRVEQLSALCHAAMGNADALHQSITSYFELADSSDPGYNEMLMLVGKVDQIKEQTAKRDKEESDWKTAVQAGTAAALLQYKVNYPQGKFIKELEGRLTGLMGDEMTDTRDGKKYPTVWIGNQRWMARDLAYMLPGAKYQSKWDKVLYSSVNNSSLCPVGWKVPDFKDMVNFFHAFGINQMPEFEGANTWAASTIASKELVLHLIAGPWDKVEGSNTYHLNFTPGGRLGLFKPPTCSNFLLKDSFVVICASEKGANVRVFKTMTPTNAAMFMCRCIEESIQK
jgi:hypothetical protein